MSIKTVFTALGVSAGITVGMTQAALADFVAEQTGLDRPGVETLMPVVATLALGQVVQVALLWSDNAFRDRSPLALAAGNTILRPEIARVIRAAYDPAMPLTARDPSHALRLAARMAREK